MRTVSKSIGSTVLALLLAACAGQPATTEQLHELEQRFMAPFLSDVTVECNELLIEMTGNFNEEVGQPATDPQLQQGPGYLDFLWTNTLGQARTSFLITVGSGGDITEPGLDLRNMTKFRVRNVVRVRKWQDQHAITLKVHARGVEGTPISIREPGMPNARRVREYLVEDGVRKAP